MMRKQEVINKLKPIALNLRNKHPWLDGKLSLLMAQVIIESGWLRHSPGNNCLGIKWTSRYPESKKQMLWTKEWVNGKYISVKAPFVKFDSLEECIEEGYIRILGLDRYKETRESKDWWDATNYIRVNGYATSPTYTNTLRKTILSNKLYKVDWHHDYNEHITDNFIWGETFSNVIFNGRKYRRIVEPYPEYWDNVKIVAIEGQKGRDYIGKSFIVNRWFSIDSYNSYIGGVPGSQHLLALAIDIRNPRGYTTYQFYKIMKRLTDLTGYGLGSRYMHIDKKDIDRIRVWYY